MIDNKHYSKHAIQTVDLIKEWDLDPYQFSMLKYIERAGHKEGASYKSDMLKAAWYAIMAVTKNKECANETVMFVTKLVTTDKS